jgi:predicted nucleic acid-binding protein
VLVPVFVGEHPHHLESAALFLGCEAEHASCAVHSLAEVYATLTRLPAPHRASPEQAIQCVRRIVGRFRLVGLDGEATLAVLEMMASQQISGGTTYDSLIAACAVKSGAARIYSWNIRHFERFGPEVAGRLVRPGEV